MRRNLTTLINALRSIESGKVRNFVEDVQNKGAATQYRLFHLLLLKEAGYCAGFDIKSTQSGYEFECWCPRLTNKGCDLLDVARSPRLFNKIKEVSKTCGLPLTTMTLQQIVYESIDSLLWEHSKERLKEKEAIKRGAK